MINLVFAVFAYVLYVVANLFYGADGLGTAAATGAAGRSVTMYRITVRGSGYRFDP